MIVQQCGKESNAWSWWYELVTYADFNKDIQLSHAEMKSLIQTKTITLGMEFGASRAESFAVTRGSNTFRYVTCH